MNWTLLLVITNQGQERKISFMSISKSIQPLPEYMTDCDQDACLIEGLHHLFAFLLIHSHGFLQEEVVALAGEGDGGAEVHAVLCVCVCG